MENPFNVTKASEYSDEQINRYWVSIGGKDALDPLEYTPKYILGGKGCGKTHLLRYYSYPLQKLRRGSFEDVLVNDKYIGVYSVFSIMDASRFEGKNIGKDQWEPLFKYYFELYISSYLLLFISDFFDTDHGKSREKEFAEGVANLFLKPISLKSYSLKGLVDFVESERKDIDFKIENVAFTGSFNDVKINLKPGGLIFGIPETIGKIYSDFKDVEFIYIMDEYEKLIDWQKRYVNTLVWEKKYPSTFWIGARKYGYTDMTTETREMLKKGSEYIPFFLDEYYQKNEKDFEAFAKELISKRLKREGKEAFDNLVAKFKNGKEEAVSTIKDSKKGNYKHIRNLSNEIKLAIKKNLVSDSENDITKILQNLIADTDNNPLEQKYKLYLFYQMWADKRFNTLLEMSNVVKKEYKAYKKGKISRFNNIVEKYKNDLIAQICEENGEEYYAFSGLDDFIKLSWGNPRVLLLLLKNTIEKAKVFHEHPLDSAGEISLRAQFFGIKKTARWYLEDAELTGIIGSYINTAINNLAKYFRVYRFSDKPTDTSVCAFNYGTEDVSHNASSLIKMMELHSLLVKVENERKQKNSGKAEITYQLNRILAPNWNLPTARRGIADFNGNVVEAIFNHDSFNKFNNEYMILKRGMNAPFVKKDDLDMQLEFGE